MEELNKKRVIIVTVILVAIIGLWAVKATKLTISFAAKIPSESYAMKEYVPIGNNYFDSNREDMSGYGIRVEELFMVPTKDLLANYELTVDDIYPETTPIPENMCIVKVQLSNENKEFNEKKRVNFLFYQLQGINFWLQIDTDIFALLNPEFEASSSVSLNGETDATIYLPFSVHDMYIDVNELYKQPIDLLISLYPVEMKIQLSWI